MQRNQVWAAKKTQPKVNEQKQTVLPEKTTPTNSEKPDNQVCTPKTTPPKVTLTNSEEPDNISNGKQEKAIQETQKEKEKTASLKLNPHYQYLVENKDKLMALKNDKTKISIELLVAEHDAVYHIIQLLEQTKIELGNGNPFGVKFEKHINTFRNKVADNLQYLLLDRIFHENFISTKPNSILNLALLAYEITKKINSNLHEFDIYGNSLLAELNNKVEQHKSNEILARIIQTISDELNLFVALYKENKFDRQVLENCIKISISKIALMLRHLRDKDLIYCTERFKDTLAYKIPLIIYLDYLDCVKANTVLNTHSLAKILSSCIDARNSIMHETYV